MALICSVNRKRNKSRVINQPFSGLFKYLEPSSKREHSKGLHLLSLCLPGSLVKGHSSSSPHCFSSPSASFTSTRRSQLFLPFSDTISLSCRHLHLFSFYNKLLLRLYDLCQNSNRLFLLLFKGSLPFSFFSFNNQVYHFKRLKMKLLLLHLLTNTEGHWVLVK